MLPVCVGAESCHQPFVLLGVAAVAARQQTLHMRTGSPWVGVLDIILDIEQGQRQGDVVNVGFNAARMQQVLEVMANDTTSYVRPISATHCKQGERH